MRDSDKKRYVKWYRLAERAMGDLIPHPARDSEILKWVSQENWLLVPTHMETDMEAAKNRPDPNIFFALENGRIRIGLVCNTQDSVRKTRNILHIYHTSERAEFLACLRELDNGFTTSVFSKEYPHHPRQAPIHREVFTMQTNQINDKSISKIFHHVDKIREKGRLKKVVENRRWIQILPTIDIAWTFAKMNDEDFLKKIGYLKPLYEICVKIKTDSQIAREMKRQKKTELVVRICPKCGIQDSSTMFCPKCGSYLSPRTMTQEEADRMKRPVAE